MRLMLLMSTILLQACAGSGRASTNAPPPEEEPVSFEIDESLDGLRLKLGEVTRPSEGGEPTPQADPEVLTPEATAALVARLPPLELRDGDRLPFAKREDSKPPPQTGATVALPFPPPEKPDVPEVTEGPLTVLRFAPQGDVDIAPHLSVTFSQPMVAVTSQDEAAKVRPVRITPEPPGTWRWVGTKTTLFEPDPRFSMATEYTVEIAASARSATGSPLDEASRWTFRTPPPKVVAAQPQDGPHGLEPFLYLAFDQAIDPAAMLRHVSLTGGPAATLRLATSAEIERESWVRQAVEAAPDNRVLVMRATEPLAPATSYALTVGAGAPSAEGPRVTETAQRFDFRTYDPLSVAHTWCDRSENRCSPSGSFGVYFSNPLDEDAFDPQLVTVEPTIEHLRVRASGNALVVSGKLQAATSYTVRIGPDLTDRFGQRLGEPAKRTFHVDHADEQLIGPPREIVVLDPAGPPALSVFTVNLKSVKARIYEVSPESFGAVSAWMRDARYDGYRKGQPPGKRLASLEIPVAAFADDALVETAIDLTPYLGADGFGHVLVWIEPPQQPKERWAQRHHFAWVQRTAVGLTAIVDGDEIVAWATSLADGKPIHGAEIGLLGQPNTVRTDAQGLARIGKYADSSGPHALLAKHGDDLAMLPQSASWWNQHGGWHTSEDATRIAWFVFDDRKMYRPSETAAIKGWIRPLEAGAGGGIGALDGLPGQLTWSLHDSHGNVIGQGETTISASGGFDLALQLPKTPNLGTARLALAASGGSLGDSHHEHTIEIQEFRRPEYQVSSHLDPRPYGLGEHALVSVNAGYYAGGPLPAAPVHWEVTSTPASYTPPGLGDYRFGPWSPWWGAYGMWGRGGHGGDYVPPESLQGQTDAAGDHTLRIDFVAVNPPRPYTVRAEATVIDVNRQRWTSGEQLLLHPASEYVGVRTEKGFYEEGEDIAVELVVADIDGAVHANRTVDVRWARLDWARKDGRWQEIETAPESCAITSAAEPVACTFKPVEGGTYRVSARITDPEGRPNETVAQVWVSGGQRKQAPTRQVTMEQLTLVPEGSEWQPGDTARILVQAPFAPAEGLLTIGRGGILETRRFTMTESTTTLELLITERSIPNLHVRVDVVGSAERTDDNGDPIPGKARRVAFASSELALSVPPLTRALTVDVKSRSAAIDPGGSTILDVTVRDASGAPVEGEVAVVVVDEAVLSLSGYATPDPIAVFYAHTGSGFHAAHLRELVVLADPDQAGAAGSEGDLLDTVTGHAGNERLEAVGAVAEAEAPMMRTMAKRESKEQAQMASPPPPPPSPQAGGASGQTVTVREDFDALALFAPHVRTDANGRATVELKLPDSLTRYRIMAVAVSGSNRFGAGESSITARKPVMLRPSPPRFLNFGDRAELPLVVQNGTDEPLVVDIAVRVANARVIPDVTQAPAGAVVEVAGRRFEVPPGDRRELRVPIAADMAGTARFQVIVATGAHTDAAAFEFPVWTPATSEAFATYGEIDDGAIRQPVTAPPEVWPQFGGLEVTTSSTAVQALTDAVLYLVQYPYDCTEQMASRVLAVAALRDVLGAFEAEQLPSTPELEAAVAADLVRIEKRQHANGGFSFWPTLPDEPYLTVHVTHALVRAKAKGFPVEERTLNRALGYLRDIERHIPGWYGVDARRTIIAYSVHVRHLLGENDADRARVLFREAGTKLPLEAQGWIVPTLQATKQSASVDALVRHWENNAAETAATAQFNVGYGDETDYVLLHSSRRTDAVLLDALIEVRQSHDLIPKLVRGLLGHRTAGRWSTTQENSFVLLSLDRYFGVYEAQTPDFVARAWLGDRFAGEHRFAGRTTEQAHIEVPMAWMTDPRETRDLILQKDGPGRLYYRVGMRYAPKDLSLAAADHGFAVERVYESIDDPADVRRDGDGTWRIRAGARVRVRVTMVAPARRYHVALVDPLPGGMEPMNPELATTGTVPQGPAAESKGRYWWWWGPWYEHQNMRDERVEAFTRQLWDGVHEYTYVATATTPGHFVVPPAKAEEMYHPETFGRSGTDRVVIE